MDDDPDDEPPSGSDNRTRVLDAAEQLFAQLNYTEVSIKRIAATAKMSKTTLYKTFSDKHEIFDFVANRFVAQVVEAMDSCLAGTGPLADRLIDALTTRNRMCAQIENSTFAYVLFNRRHGEVEMIVQQLGEQVRQQLLTAITGAGIDPDKGTILARVLAATSDGIAHHMTDQATADGDVAIIVRALIPDGT
ncbi:MAG: TetR/AcrR family transcriptional regulator [Pseudomonadota bacterium]